jgi:5-(carboxyamino)imidazole ribonucleotide synthase
MGPPKYKGLKELARIPGMYIHLYGKKEMKPGRKMGHLTLIALPNENILEKVFMVKKMISEG